MNATEAETISRLREALQDPAAAPEALADLRRHAVGDTPLATELFGRELRWLQAQAARSGRPDLAAESAAAYADWLRWRFAALVATAGDDPSAYFDLAELAGLAEVDGEAELAAQCRDEVRRRAPAVAVAPGIAEEAAERTAAALSIAAEALPLPREAALLAADAEAMERLAEAGGDRTCVRWARRLRRRADDRRMAMARERRFGRRGVAAIETLNVVLLAVVLASLVVEGCVELTAAQLWVLHAVDAAACTFFVVDFVVQFALHPRRWNWFARNVFTDLLPAIPAVLWLLPASPLPAMAEDVILLRWVRVVRVAWAARYLQAMRPLVRSLRLLVFLVRGMDGLVERFAGLLDRDFVFVPGKRELARPLAEERLRDLAYTSLRREQDLVALLADDARPAALLRRIAELREQLRRVPAGRIEPEITTAARETPIDLAIETLWTLRPQDLPRWLRPGDVQALDRVARVLSARPVRWLPIVRNFAVPDAVAGAEERVVALAHRVAAWLEGWHSKLLFHADLHGIVTGPQILDRIATALVKATQRPTLRLLLIGGVLALFGKERFSEPVLILGAVCLGLFSLGLWMKRIAGEAAEAYRLTSEAHFLSQVELVKRRYEAEDLRFLAARVFGGSDAAQRALRAQLSGTRAGVPAIEVGADPELCLEANRVALLYLHFLDGAPLHVSDVKSTEQLLANQSLANLRVDFLGHGRRERKQLRRLRLDEGTILRGPFLWFRFITESIAVETAKRIAGYNRCCLPLAEAGRATDEDRERMARWLQWRRDPRAGRTIGAELDLLDAQHCVTTEFNALDFVGADPERDRHIAATFGDEVLAALRQDRRTMVREIFGTRPVHRLPKAARSFNPLRIYRSRLSGGRVLFAPVLLAWRFLRSIGWLIARTRQIVREVFHPELAMQLREPGEAPFAVALRKIHRMKAPGLLEAMRLRLAVDPEYAGAPAGWSSGAPYASPSPLEHDLQFLQVGEREAAELRDKAATVRRRVAALHALVRDAAFHVGDRSEAERDAAFHVGDRSEAERDAGELAVTAAWLADRGGVRDLFAAERWRREVLPTLLRDGLAEVPAVGLGAARRLLGPDELDALIERQPGELPHNARRLLARARACDWQGARRALAAWAKVPSGTTPREHALASLRIVYGRGTAVRRDLLTLRTVQSLAVLDVRNHRDLVFKLGEYGADGEDATLAERLPN